MKHLRKVADLDLALIDQIIQQAFRYRDLYRQGLRKEDRLGGKVVAMIFEKPSLRTKVAFEVATSYLGGCPVFLSSSQILASGGNQKGRESVADIARNLERFGDLIVARVYKHEVIEQISSSTQIPVINALCDRHHPTQALADLMTLRMFFPNPERRLRVAFVGDGNNVATSLMQICAMAGVDFRIATPIGYELPKEQVTIAKEMARKNSSQVIESGSPQEVVADADAVYTDTFVSMGQEEEKQARQLAFRNYQINSKLMQIANKDAIFLHCLPAYRGEEVTDDVMDSKWSRVFDQAECRMHIAKALLVKFLG
jgi:ornithine carbamoyltransferase